MDRYTRILLLFLLITLVFPLRAAADPCDFTSGGAITFTQEQVFACFESVPFRHDDLENILDVVAQHRSFSDLAELYDARTGWVDRFNALYDEEFTSDYRMHVALTAEHKSLLNPHVRYRPPRCYHETFVAFVPFDFGVTTRFLKEGEDQIVFIEGAPLAPDLYQFATGIDARELVGMKVVEINGVPALDYFRAFGREQLLLDDNDGVHLNAVMGSLNYSVRFGVNDYFPERGADFYLLESRNRKRFSVTMPWVFVWRGAVGLPALPLSSSTEEFVEFCMEPFPTAPAAAGLDGFWHDNGEIDRQRRAFVQERIGGPGVTNKDFFEVPPGLLGKHVEIIEPSTNEAVILQFRNNVTAIRLFNTGSWVDVARAGIEHACQNSDRLILDVRRNGGGNDTVIRWIAHHLFPEEDLVEVGKVPVRIRNDEAAANEFFYNSAWFESLLVPLGFPPCAVSFGPTCFMDLDGGDPLPLEDLDWFLDPSVVEMRAGVPVSLSDQVGLGQHLSGLFPDFDVASCAGRFTGKDLILLTSGTNGSGGYFLPAAFKGKGVIVTTGGFVGEPISMGIARSGPTMSAHTWAWLAAWMEYFSDGLVTFDTQYAQFDRFVFSNMETWGAYRKDDRSILHFDDPVEADLHVDVWSDSFFTEGYVYSRVLEAVDAMDLP